MGHCYGNDLRRRIAGIRQAIEAAGTTLLYRSHWRHIAKTNAGTTDDAVAEIEKGHLLRRQGHAGN